MSAAANAVRRRAAGLLRRTPDLTAAALAARLGVRYQAAAAILNDLASATPGGSAALPSVPSKPAPPGASPRRRRDPDGSPCAGKAGAAAPEIRECRPGPAGPAVAGVSSATSAGPADAAPGRSFREPAGCRWIDGEVGRDWRYCQAPPVAGTAWCAAHHARCYVRRAA